MTWSEKERRQRLRGISADDQRSPYGRDRDRILYTSAFHRLAGVTQIVRAGEADVFHTRQQHTIKVGQVGRRLAEWCLEDQPDQAEQLGVHPEVVEAACLAHDLGHPPFGHVGEKVLNRLVEDADDPDGYEGNAQSFRILTKLSLRYDQCNGLDLTRAVLAASLKYPWTRDRQHEHKTSKWSVYRTEQEDFDFAREFHNHEMKTAEAELMDWADDVSYSAHDLEDFHRCGAIPWRRIFSKEGQDELVERTHRAWFAAPLPAEALIRSGLRNLTDLFQLFPAIINERYIGSRPQRLQLRTLTSSLIKRYIQSVKLVIGDPTEPAVSIDEGHSVEVRVLKQITKDYIISSPPLAAQQHGQKKILGDLFQAFHEESKQGPPSFLPTRLQYLWVLRDESPPRFVADCLASLTESEAVRLHGRLFGSDSGSVLDPIVR